MARLALILFVLVACTSVWSQGGVPIAPFDMIGFISDATVDNPGDPLSSGTITVNNIKIVVPANTIFQMPATNLGWGELFSMAPAAISAGGTRSGLALNDSPRLEGTYEAHVVGNIVNGVYTAGLIFLSQQSLHSGQGFIESIDYVKGELKVAGTRIQINDPKGKFSKQQSPDPRFTIDEDNPTVRTETGFPMCLPRTDPSVTDDPKCPQYNRPKDSLGNRIMNFTMLPPGIPGLADARLMAPFEVGDYITYAGLQITDGNGPYISAWQIIANVGIYTAPGVDPAYIAIDVILEGAGGTPSPNFPQEATTRSRVEGFTTDSTRTVEILAVDRDCNGNETERPWASFFAVDQGPPTGAVKGRWRFRPTGGAFLPPVREVRARITGAQNTVQPNGLISAWYQAPNFEFIFPENLGIGSPPVPLNLEDFVFLVNGSGPLHDDLQNLHLVKQLNPWPGLSAPTSTCVSNLQPTPNTPPTAVAVANPTSGTKGDLINLDATQSTPSAGLSFNWVQSSNDPLQVSLANATSAMATFTVPNVSSATTFNFNVTVQNAGGSSSAGVSVTINPPASVMAPNAVAKANPSPAASASLVTLDASGSTDPNNPALTPLNFAWTQTSGSPVSINNANAAVATFSAPTILAGQSNQTLSFNVKVTNSSGISSNATVNVTVNAVIQPPVAKVVASPNPANSGAVVSLNASGSTDPQGGTLTYKWIQTGGPSVSLANAATAVAGFVAPGIAPGQPAGTLTFSVTVTSASGLSSTAQISVTVRPLPDSITITSAVYKANKARLTVNVTDTAISPNINITCTLPIINPATGKQVSAVMTNGLNGLYTIVFTGWPLPSSVSCVSSAGGSTGPFTAFRVQ
jgi:hypothetical protein